MKLTIEEVLKYKGCFDIYCINQKCKYWHLEDRMGCKHGDNTGCLGYIPFVELDPDYFEKKPALMAAEGKRRTNIKDTSKARPAPIHPPTIGIQPSNIEIELEAIKSRLVALEMRIATMGYTND